MRGTGQHGVAAEGTDGLGDARVVGGDGYRIDRSGRGGPPIDVLHHGTAGDIDERLAWEAGGGESRRDQGDRAEGLRRPTEGISERVRVHVEC